jgi:hypothetical protein
MRLRIVLLWGLLLVSCVQLRAQEQEIDAKFNSQPVINISDGTVKINFDYSFYGKDENVRFKYAIFDSNGKKVSDKNFNINGMSHYNPLIFDYREFEGYKSPFYLSASISWNYSEGEYLELATTDKVPFSLNVGTPSSSTNSTAYQEKKVCSYCNGTGFVKCSHCDGYGYLEPGFGPRGNGQLGGGNTTCPECRGTKTKECPLKKEYPQLHSGGNRDSHTAHGSQGESTADQTKKSYRQHFNDGSYADVTENADGTTTMVHHKKCFSCKGSGYCSICDGQGGKVVGVYTKQWRGCTLCGGNGKCKYCNGTGESIMVQTYDPSTKTAVGQDMYTGKTYRSTYGEKHDRNGSSSHSSTSSSSKCSICNGTGIDPHAYYSGDPKPAVGGYTHSSGGKCIYCGKYEWHQHVYCPKCNANKYP